MHCSRNLIQCVNQIARELIANVRVIIITLRINTLLSYSLVTSNPRPVTCNPWPVTCNSQLVLPIYLYIPPYEFSVLPKLVNPDQLPVTTWLAPDRLPVFPRPVTCREQFQPLTKYMWAPPPPDRLTVYPPNQSLVTPDQLSLYLSCRCYQSLSSPVQSLHYCTIGRSCRCLLKP